MSQIDRAADILRAGGLVAFPTETVYGLGADATQPDAVLRIFAAKGRPPTNPLIVHVASEAVAQRYAAHWPEIAATLAREFWPGPLTLVVPKAPSIVSQCTAGLPTVGLRCPDHPMALDLLRAFDGPIAAPSANRSTRVSPTTAQHVREELGEAVNLILDGGPCRVGIESTVLDLAAQTPRILRPGGVSRQQIEHAIGPVELAAEFVAPHIPAASPGQHRLHYSPHTPAYWFSTGDLAALAPRLSGPVAAVLLGEQPAAHAQVTIAMPTDPAQYAQNLYSALRGIDKMGLTAIYIEMPPDHPQWTAIRDRLRRAARPAPPAESA